MVAGIIVKRAPNLNQFFAKSVSLPKYPQNVVPPAIAAVTEEERPAQRRATPKIIS